MTKLQTLAAAVRAAIKNGCPRSAISVPAWSATYKLPQSQIRETWHAELTKATNANDIGDGK